MLNPRCSSPVWITTFYVELGFSPYRMGTLNRFEGVVLGVSNGNAKKVIYSDPLNHG